MIGPVPVTHQMTVTGKVYPKPSDADTASYLVRHKLDAMVRAGWRVVHVAVSVWNPLELIGEP